MKLSIIVPVYNEKNNILKILERIEAVNLGKIKKEIIIVDDFSTDGTREILRKIKKHKVFYHPKNLGKGAGIRTGLKYVSGELVIIQDADLEYDPNEYMKLIKPILDSKADVVYGNRFTGQDRPRNITSYLANIFLTLITNLFYSSKIRDMETCYKVFKSDIIKNIKIDSDRFNFEPEITAKVLKKGYKIYEVPISYSSRNHKEGKKITWKDGLQAIWALVKYKFVD